MGVEDTALIEWKRIIFTIVDKRIKFYSQNTIFLPPKPKSSFRHLKLGIQEFHRKKYKYAMIRKWRNQKEITTP